MSNGRKKIKVICEMCGIELLRHVCKVEKAKHIFCFLCSKEYNRQRMSKWNKVNNKLAWKKALALKGDMHPNYKGLSKRPDGYVRILTGVNKRELYHRYVMENYLGRKLSNKEIVHHKDGNPGNNNIDNLIVTDRQEHMLLHSGN